MDALERDYGSVLLASHAPPCLSLYQPTHRTYPDRLQDPIRFRKLVRDIELALRQDYPGRDIAQILRPFNELARDEGFWITALDGLAVFAAANVFRVYRLQRPVRERAIVANSFHTKPLMRILQSADRYRVLGLSRQAARLFEGNRYVLDEVQPPAGFPRTAAELLGTPEGEPERKARAYGPSGPGSTYHGTDVREEEKDIEAERFFRAVDRAVLEHYSGPYDMPLLLAALPEHHHLFRSVSRNPSLMAQAIDADPGALKPDDLRERAWQLILPRYLERLNRLVELFGEARAKHLGADDLAEIARAAVAGRVANLLIDADREVFGRFDPATGAIEFVAGGEPGVDDLLDDVGEQTLKTGGEVVIVPAERMPTDSGVAAIYRY